LGPRGPGAQRRDQVTRDAVPQANARPADTRGAVEVTGHAVKAVTAGPALVHGYSGFSGGQIFVAPIVAGDDTDCAAALAKQEVVSRTTLVADQMAYVPVGAGQVACLVTDTRRPFELLWHAFPVTAPEMRLASAKR
jgi:hypothetical protein